MRDLLFSSSTLLFLGAFFTVVGTLRAGWESKRDLSEFANKLQDSSNEIIRLSKLNSSLITGGDSFPDVLALFAGDPSTGFISFMVMNSSQTPLYDLKVVITDQQRVEAEIKKLVAQGKNISNELAAFKHQFIIGTLSSSQATNLLTLPYDKNLKHVSYFIESSARNGNFRQVCDFFKIGDKWLRATQIYRPGEGVIKKFKEEIDSNIPREHLKGYAN